MFFQAPSGRNSNIVLCFLCFVVVLCIFIFVCTSVGLLPPGESPVAVSSSSSNNNSNNNDNNVLVGDESNVDFLK